MEALIVIEKIVIRLEKEFQERKELINRFNNKHNSICSLFDFSNIVEELNEQDENDRFKMSLFDKLLYYTENGYAFMPYAFYKACESKLQPANKDTKGHYHCFQLKENESIDILAG